MLISIDCFTAEERTGKLFRKLKYDKKQQIIRATKANIGKNTLSESPESLQSGMKGKTGRASKFILTEGRLRHGWRRMAQLFLISKSPEAGKVRKLQEDMLKKATRQRCSICMSTINA